MKLYEIEVGATYWVAAENIREALTVLWDWWENEGCVEDARDCGYLHIDEVPEKKSEKLRFREDGEKNAGRLMIDAAKECEQPEVIACSEWG